MNAAQIVKRNRIERRKLRDGVSRVLKKYMAENRMSHVDVAWKLACHSSQIYRLIDGTRTAEAVMVQRIAKLCGTTVERIINGGK